MKMSDEEDYEDGPVVTPEDIARLSQEQETQQLGLIMPSLHFEEAIQAKINYLNRNILFSEVPRIVIYVYVYQPAEYVINVLGRIVFRIDLSFNVNGAWARITKNPSGGGESFVVVMSGGECVTTMHRLLQTVYGQTLNSDQNTGHVTAAIRLIDAQSREKPKRLTTRMITDLEQICNRISIIQSMES